jgi:hypothetical protein
MFPKECDGSRALCALAKVTHRAVADPGFTVGIRGGTGAGARGVPDGQGFATGVWQAQAAGGPVKGGSAEEGARSGAAPGIPRVADTCGGHLENA